MTPSHEPDPEDDGPSRRTVLKAAGAATLGAPLAPAFVSALEKSGGKETSIGQGEYRRQ